MTNFSALIATLLIVFSTNSYSGEESFIDLQYEAAMPANGQAVIAASNCEVLVAPPQDQRLNKATLGTTFRDNPIISKQGATDWLQQALLGMNKLGLKTNVAANTTEAPAAHSTLLSTELQRLYLWNHSMNLQTTLVVKATMQTGSAEPTHHYYRIVGTKLNWINGDSEFVSTFNIAAQRLLNQMAADINKQCRI